MTLEHALKIELANRIINLYFSGLSPAQQARKLNIYVSDYLDKGGDNNGRLFKETWESD